jgi:hypothetical protein
MPWKETIWISLQILLMRRNNEENFCLTPIQCLGILWYANINLEKLPIGVFPLLR